MYIHHINHMPRIPDSCDRPRQLQRRHQGQHQNLHQNLHQSQRRHQAGFSLVEVSIVMAIVLLLAIIAIPAISAYVIESKVPKVGEELTRFILHAKVNAANGLPTPYDGIGNANLANMVRDTGVFTISGAADAPTVRHGLGSAGEVTVATVDSGAAFTITLSKVNHAACPSIASVMQRVSDSITVAGNGGAASVIKDAATRYSALATESQCSEGDENTFVFKVL